MENTITYPFIKGQEVILNEACKNLSKDTDKLKGKVLTVVDCYHKIWGKCTATILILKGENVKNPYLAEQFKIYNKDAVRSKEI